MIKPYTSEEIDQFVAKWLGGPDALAMKRPDFERLIQPVMNSKEAQVFALTQAMKNSATGAFCAGIMIGIAIAESEAAKGDS